VCQIRTHPSGNEISRGGRTAYVVHRASYAENELTLAEKEEEETPSRKAA